MPVIVLTRQVNRIPEEQRAVLEHLHAVRPTDVPQLQLLRRAQKSLHDRDSRIVWWAGGDHAPRLSNTARLCQSLERMLEATPDNDLPLVSSTDQRLVRTLFRLQHGGRLARTAQPSVVRRDGYLRIESAIPVRFLHPDEAWWRQFDVAGEGGAERALPSCNWHFTVLSCEYHETLYLVVVVLASPMLVWRELVERYVLPVRSVVSADAESAAMRQVWGSVRRSAVTVVNGLPERSGHWSSLTSHGQSLAAPQ
ncbi:MAG: hypothetical protein IPJ56_02590 [Gemmatimonadetes bacterium]|nr:hypothetical protein [Gemmatimonadota bacterium]